MPPGRNRATHRGFNQWALLNRTHTPALRAILKFFLYVSFQTPRGAPAFTAGRRNELVESEVNMVTGYAQRGFSKSRMWCIALTGGLFLTMTGCGSKANNASSGSANSSGPAATIDPTTSGSITGSVRLDGAPPALRAIDMNAAPACVKANPSPIIPPQVVTGDNGALADVAIYIKSGLGKRHFDSPSTPVVLEQKACMYEPHVIALMVNQKLEVRNDDATAHNVHLLAKANPPWNKSQPTDAPAIEESFSQPELGIPVACNVHPWMRAFAFVFDNPYYAITSRAGNFELDDLPPGTYVIEAWQERYGTQDQTVTVGPKELKRISFTFKSVNPEGTDSRIPGQ